MSVCLRIAYDGTDFHGYARQTASDGASGRAPSERSVRTVQAVIESALARLYKQPLTIRAASRTDAGVHARGQLVAFDAPFVIPVVGLVSGLNAILPADVSVLAAFERSAAGGGPFQPRYENDGKHYRYRIRCTRVRDPIRRRDEWHLARALNVDEMRNAALRLVGRHDFASFRAADCQAKTTVRRIHTITCSSKAAAVGPSSDPGGLDAGDPATAVDLLVLDIIGEAFLKNMVRIMVGTLVDVGRGKRSAESVVELLHRPDRTLAGMTAPAAGLTLVEVLLRTPNVSAGPISSGDAGSAGSAGSTGSGGHEIGLSTAAATGRAASLRTTQIERIAALAEQGRGTQREGEHRTDARDNGEEGHEEVLSAGPT